MLNTLFLIAAVVGGTIMVCQFLLTMLGLGDSDAEFGEAGDFEVDAGGDVGDFDADGDHHTTIHHAADADVDHIGSSRLFQVLSFRSVVAAIAFFGLGGLGGASMGYSPAITVAIASIAGLAALYGMYSVMNLLYSMQSSGNVDIRNALGKPATIYIPVPAAGGGKGKVQVTVQGRTMEYEAITEDNEPLSTGENVVINRILSSDVVMVEREQEEQAVV